MDTNIASLENLVGSVKRVMQLKLELEDLYEQKVSMLRQRARINWYFKGDKNTRFYHKIIQKRRCRNLIRKILWNGSFISEPNEVKSAFYFHFSNLFKKVKSPVELLLGSLETKALSESDSRWLDRELSIEEFDLALGKSSLDKSPGPDGLSAGFIKALWSSLRKSLFECFKSFSLTGVLPVGINSSFLALIPKVDQSSMVTDYRPISLINTSAKLFSKVLSERLCSVINKLVSDN